MKIKYKALSLLVTLFLDHAVFASDPLISLSEGIEAEQKNAYESNWALWETGNDEEMDRAQQGFRSITSDHAHKYAPYSAGILLYSGDISDREFALFHLRTMLTGSVGEIAINAAGLLAHLGTIHDRTAALSILRSFLKLPEFSMFAACELLPMAYEEDKVVALPLVRNAIDHTDHFIARKAADLVLAFGVDEDRVVSLARLRLMLTSSEPMLRVMAANSLWYTKNAEEYLEDNLEDRAIILTVLRAFANNSKSPHKVLAACMLVNSDDTSDKETSFSILRTVMNPRKRNIFAAWSLQRSELRVDKDISLQVQRSVAGDLTHPNARDAAACLFNSENQEDKKLGHSSLRTITSDLEHPASYEAAIFLWNGGNDEDKDIARPALYAVASDPKHPKAYEISCKLWETRRDTDRAAARLTLYAVASNLEQPKSYDASVLLWNSNSPEDIAAAYPAICAASSDSKHPRYFDAILLLWTSSNIEDQAVARPILHLLASGSSSLKCRAFTYLFSPYNTADDRRIAEDAAKQIISDLNHVDNYTVVNHLLYATGEFGEIREYTVNHIRTVLSEGRGSEQLREDYTKLLERY